MDKNSSNHSLLPELDLNIYSGIVRSFEIIVLAATLWVLSCTVCYGHKTKKWKLKSGSSSMDRGMIYCCCVVAVTLTIPRIIFTSVLLFLPVDAITSNCETLMDTSNGLHFCAVYPAYFFLWLRQRAIYNHPAARHLAGKAAIVLGWIVLVILSMSSVALTCAFIIPVSYTASRYGCVTERRTDGKINKSLYYILAGFSTICQLVFLSLFIYPMIKCQLDQMKNRKRSIVADDLTASKQSFISRFKRGISSEKNTQISREKNCQTSKRSNAHRSRNCLVQTIRRSVVSTAITILSDFVAMGLVSFVVPENIPRTFTDCIYDVSLLINTLCLLATFGGNTTILTVFCKILPAKRDSGSVKALESSQSFVGHHVIDRNAFSTTSA